jgi:transcription initiation factor TFIIE subunit alpha
MRLTKKLMSEVISQTSGVDAVDVAMYLKGKEDVSELVVAKQMNLSVQEARALLYKLYEFNFVKFERKRDKHKGWHISHWDLVGDNIIKNHVESQQTRAIQLRDRIEREQSNNFYMCKYACSRNIFEDAVERNFKCPECGALMNPQDNSRTIEVLSGKLKELETKMVT